MTRFEAVTRKEINDLLSHPALVFSFLGLVFFFVLVPISLLALVGAAGDSPMGERGIRAVEQLQQLVPGLAGVTSNQQRSVLLVHHFSLIFLVLPVIGALGSSSSSVVGEKQNRSLEPVLATPVSPGELLAGKCVGTMSLAVLGTWMGVALYGLCVYLIAGPGVFFLAFDLTVILMVLLLTPLVALLGLGVGVIISTRVKDSRSAQQLGGLLVIPIILLIGAQMGGLFIFGPRLVFSAALVLAAADLIVLKMGIKLFDRERMLTDWS